MIADLELSPAMQDSGVPWLIGALPHAADRAVAQTPRRRRRRR